MLALIDVGHTPVSLTMKPDGGEMIVCNFDANSISIVETGNDEVGSSQEIGQHPSKGVVTLDNSRLYVSNFGSNSVAVYDIDMGRRIWTIAVGSRPEPGPDARSELLTCSGYGIRRRHGYPEAKARRTLETSEYSLITLIPVGMQPNAIVIKAFLATTPAKK